MASVASEGRDSSSKLSRKTDALAGDGVRVYRRCSGSILKA